MHVHTTKLIVPICLQLPVLCSCSRPPLLIPPSLTLHHHPSLLPSLLPHILPLHPSSPHSFPLTPPPLTLAPHSSSPPHTSPLILPILLPSFLPLLPLFLPFPLSQGEEEETGVTSPYDLWATKPLEQQKWYLQPPTEIKDEGTSVDAPQEKKEESLGREEQVRLLLHIAPSILKCVLPPCSFERVYFPYIL